MNRDELLQELTEDILAYVMHGMVPERELGLALKPAELDDRFTEYEKLLDLHFILLPEVIEFVELLPQRIRSLNTATESVTRTQRGAVDGKIDWGATVKRRHSRNPGDRSIFVCQNRTEDYDTDENLVFKRLIMILYETLREADEYLARDYQWISDRWNATLVNELRRTIEQNVHIRRIREPKTYEPTDRMRTAAANSRHEIYRDVAALLETRRDLYAGDQQELRRLLNQTAITPDDDETLLELFVLFRFIAALERLHAAEVQFETIERDRQEVARLTGEAGHEIVVYHDNSARDRGLSFRPVPDTKPEYSRTEEVHRTGRDIAGRYFSDRNFRTQTGRPDLIVIEITHPDGDHDYLITEVKNSTNTETIRQGIKETLEYLAFLRADDDYVYGDAPGEGYFGDGWNGLLVVQDLAEPTASLEDQTGSPIKILQASELAGSLEDMITRLYRDSDPTA